MMVSCRKKELRVKVKVKNKKIEEMNKKKLRRKKFSIKKKAIRNLEKK